MPPIRKVSEIVVSTLMPISRAASGSCAVARIALPSRLRPMNVVIAISSGIVRKIARRSPLVTSMPPITNSSFCERIRSVMPSCEPPSHSRPTFWRMKEKPTAVISGASLGALRNGR